MAKNNGGPAFPHMMAEGHKDYAGGMSLRDYFAARALPGIIIANPQARRAEWAIEAYCVADEMMIEATRK